MSKRTTRHIGIRVTEEQFNALKARAEEYNLTLSQFLLHAARMYVGFPESGEWGGKRDGAGRPSKIE